jgi:hypothetical protein
MNMKCITLAVALASAISAQAALNPITQTLSVPSQGFGSFPTTLNFNGTAFYPGLGTLISIQYSLDGSSSLLYTSLVHQSPAVSLGGVIGGDGNAHVTAIGPNVASPKLDASVNIPLTAVLNNQVNTPIGAGSGSVGLTSDFANAANYAGGAASVNFTVDTLGQATVTAQDTTVGLSASAFGAATVVLKYVFQTQDVPEASTYAALGALALAGGFVGLRRRLA